MQGSSSKVVPTEKDFVKANKASFGSAIGTITNYATSMYNVISNFEPGSEEYDELLYRLMCMQDYQQAEIDKAKGCLARPVLKEWYDFKVNKILPEDDEATIIEKEFNLSILANKKPYFFIYNYDKLKSEFMEYYKPNNQVCMAKYKCEIHELYKKPNKTCREKEFLINYEFGCPVNVSPCLCNKIAWMVEDHFRTMEKYRIQQFDCSKLKNPEIEYSTYTYNKIKKLKEKYDEAVEKSIKTQKHDRSSTYDVEDIKLTLHEQFIEQCYVICSNEDELCNIVIDLCYSTNKSKQFAWELCGDVIIRNLLRNNDNKLRFPKQSEHVEFSYKGLDFKMEEIEYEAHSE
jgi:hypothetical protein